jgi:hypothetical protein
MGAAAFAFFDTDFTVGANKGKTRETAWNTLALARFMHEGCRGGLRTDQIAAMVLMAA